MLDGTFGERVRTVVPVFGQKKVYGFGVVVRMAKDTAVILTEATIRELLFFDDAGGVLSFMTGRVPAQASATTATASLELRNQAKNLVTEVQTFDADQARLIQQRIEQSSRDIEWLTDPTVTGRGRCLYIGVGSGKQVRVSLHVPLADRLVYHERPYLRPLIAALDAGQATGIVVVTSDKVRTLTWALGEAKEGESFAFSPSENVVGRERKGPSSSAGGADRGQSGTAHREQLEDRMDEHRARFLKATMETIVQQFLSAGVAQIALSASPKLRDPVRNLLEPSGIAVLPVEASWHEAAPHAIAEALWDVVAGARRDREQALVDLVLSRGLGGGPAALGVSAVCEALNDGRVERLMYDTDMMIPGYVDTQSGRLYANDHGSPSLRAERYFVERMVGAALLTKAAVTPLSQETAAPLGPYDRVAALLRW